jgi:hypothetical protein
MNIRTVLGFGLCLLLIGCDDSKSPLSDSQTAKPDEGLVGIWRDSTGEVYYHVGHAGKGFPKGVMRIVEVEHDQEGVKPPNEYLAYSTVLGGKTYLNVVIDAEQVKRLDEKGWKSNAVECYTFVKYRLDGDKLVAWAIDEMAKEQAIKSGKIKGIIPKDDKADTFTDTTENVARFVANAPDTLWKKEPGRFERVTLAAKQ